MPAQQVLASAADRWGLLGLLAMIRSVDPDTAMLGMGTDLSLAGFELGLNEYVPSSTRRRVLRLTEHTYVAAVTFTPLS